MKISRGGLGAQSGRGKPHKIGPFLPFLIQFFEQPAGPEWPPGRRPVWQTPRHCGQSNIQYWQWPLHTRWVSIDIHHRRTIQYTSLHVLRIAILISSTMHCFYSGLKSTILQAASIIVRATGCATWYIPANEPQILELEYLKPTSKTISTWKMARADMVHVTSSGAIFAADGQIKSNSCLPSLNS